MHEPYGETKITPIGVTDWRDRKQLFVIKEADRLRHVYALGKTGVGKSSCCLIWTLPIFNRVKAFAF